MQTGFIGFGEAGYTIGKGLVGAGVGQLFAYDISWQSPDRGALIRQRAADAGVTLVASPAELAAETTILISTVTCSSALDAARQHAPFLRRSGDPRGAHIYADLNSVSPEIKRRIAAVISEADASFVEVAVMAPVGPYAQRVPMLLGGPGAERFVEAMQPFGMRLQVLPAAGIGTAAAVKMCRSVVVKGLEALLTECVLGASEYGAIEHVFASLQESYPGIDWNKLADYNINRLIVHGERRAREMEEVAETLQEAGIEPIMAAATARRQDWSAKLGLKQYFPPDGPDGTAAVLAVLARLKKDATAVTVP
jgi:3-hydroxyisobutyrate dehydrogenase-like beta-hydroxyacid dehydrogenase